MDKRVIVVSGINIFLLLICVGISIFVILYSVLVLIYSRMLHMVHNYNKNILYNYLRGNIIFPFRVSRLYSTFPNCDAIFENPERDEAWIDSELDNRYNSVIVSNICLFVVLESEVCPICEFIIIIL